MVDILFLEFISSVCVLFFTLSTILNIKTSNIKIHKIFFFEELIIKSNKKFPFICSKFFAKLSFWLFLFFTNCLLFNIEFLTSSTGIETSNLF